jgi:hypothetical protein
MTGTYPPAGRIVRERAQGRHACPAGERSTGTPPVPAQELPARPHASRGTRHDIALASDGPLVDLASACGSPGAPGAAPGMRSDIPATGAPPGSESRSRMEGFQAEDRHNPLPHIALSPTALKSAYRNTASLSTYSATELQEFQDWSGLEWQRPVLLRLASARRGIVRSVLSGKGACGRPELITGLHAGASGVTPGITG